MFDLVSIIMPVYNSKAYLEDTIHSVLSQTYTHWELLMVDDLSTDDSYEIMKKYARQDTRIKAFQLSEKGGASMARNLAIKNAKGRFIAYLDADDLWIENKLERQVAFMKEHDYAFSFHPYSYIDHEGKPLHIKRLAPKRISYKTMLHGCEIGCLSVMYDANKVGLVQIKRIDKRNDDAMWITILRRVQYGYCLDEDLAYYRKGNPSLSSGSKLKLLKFHYRLYRIICEFSHIKSCYYTIWNIYTYFKVKMFREVKSE